MLYQPIESINYAAWAMEGATAGAKRCFEVLDREDDVVDSPNAIEIESAKGAIGFQKVSFGYAQKSGSFSRTHCSFRQRSAKILRTADPTRLMTKSSTRRSARRPMNSFANCQTVMGA